MKAPSRHLCQYVNFNIRLNTTVLLLIPSGNVDRHEPAIHNVWIQSVLRIQCVAEEKKGDKTCDRMQRANQTDAHHTEIECVAT